MERGAERSAAAYFPSVAAGGAPAAAGVIGGTPWFIWLAAEPLFKLPALSYISMQVRIST